MRRRQRKYRRAHAGNVCKTNGVVIAFLSVLVLICLSGCARLQAFAERTFGKKHEQVEVPDSNTATLQASRQYLVKAETFARQDEPKLALSYFYLAKALNPNDQAITFEIESLQAAYRQKAEKHLEKGIEHFQKNRFDEARRQFLIVLRYAPENQKALHYLRKRLIPSHYRSYKVKQADNLKLIAKKVYDDPGKDFLVAFFNNLKTDQMPKPGTWLKIPHLEAEFAVPFFDVKSELDKAYKALEQKDYGDAVGITSKILEYDYLNKEAAVVRNEAYFQMGLRLVRQDKYEAAMNMLAKVDEEHAGLTPAFQDAHKQELQRAEALLQSKAYARALTVAQRVLQYDPSNAEASELINRIVCDHGNALVAEKKYAEAMEMVAQGDERSYCISEIKAAIITHLKKQAETHYLQGVKYFLLEDLQQAINEWEIAVQLDPEHDKARSGIQNARHLLEQLDRVE